MKRLSKEDKIGLYVTVIIHLAVAIILMLFVVTPNIRKTNEFIIDFSKTEEVEKLQKELELKKDINRKLKEMLAKEGIRDVSPKNVSVDRSRLKDDRNTDAEQLYRDAERIAADFAKGYNYDTQGDVPIVGRRQEEQSADVKPQDYEGKSTVSFKGLSGRHALSLPAPSYRCESDGEVVVIIGINRSGEVIEALIFEERSSTNEQLRKYALKYARKSRFDSDRNAPEKVFDEISYIFVAQ